MTTVFGNTYSPYVIQNLIANDLLVSPISSCIDSQGNLFIGCESNGNTLFVIPPIDSTIFGIACTGNTLNNLASIPGLPASARPVLCLDSNDTLYIGDYFSNGLYVIPQTTSTIFSVACNGNEATNLRPTVDPGAILVSPTGMTFDSVGNLFIVNGWASGGVNKIFVLPPSPTTLFGIPCTENLLNNLSTLDTNVVLGAMRGLCIDSAGNLYIGSHTVDRSICVLPVQSGTLYGISVTQNVVSILIIVGSDPWGLRIDSYGNLFWAENDTLSLHVLPIADAVLFSVTCVKDTPIDLTSSVDPNLLIANPYDICFDSNNNLFIINRNTTTPAILPNAFPTFQYPVFGIYISNTSTFLFDYTTVKRYVAGQSISAIQGSFVMPGLVLTDLRRTVYSYGKNKLQTYAFREVQLPDSLISAYICIWAASGVYPVMLS